MLTPANDWIENVVEDVDVNVCVFAIPTSRKLAEQACARENSGESACAVDAIWSSSSSTTMLNDASEQIDSR